MRGPLQHEIVSLIRLGHQTPQALLRILGRHYDISPATVRVSLWRLARRGIIKRTKRGCYEAQ